MTGILVVPGPDIAWGFDVEQISAIVAESEWFGAVPVEVERWLGIPAGWSAEPRRVLVVRARGGEIAVRVGGTLGIREVAAADIYALPELVVDRSLPGLFTGVLLSRDATPLLVLDPDGVARRAAHAMGIDRTNGGT